MNSLREAIYTYCMYIHTCDKTFCKQVVQWNSFELFSTKNDKKGQKGLTMRTHGAGVTNEPIIRGLNEDVVFIIKKRDISLDFFKVDTYS